MPPDLRGVPARPAGRDGASAALVVGLPAAFATTLFDSSDPLVAEVCTTDSRRQVLRTDSLPVPMRREISWWMAACHQDGERVLHLKDWRRWVAAAVAVVRDRPEVESFADLTLSEWSAAWARAFHADHGRLPAAATRRRAESGLRGLLPRLAVRYSDAPWWTHDVWCPRFDPRIPRRPHEPLGESSVRWDDIAPPWLRRRTSATTSATLT